MTDLENAIKALEGHSICLCRGENIIVSDGRGISPVLAFIESNGDYRGFSAADVVVGKAAAEMFVKLGITAVYGKVMSKSAQAFLTSRGIIAEFGEITEKIINRKGDGICPMEKTVMEIDNVDEAYAALKCKVDELKAL